MMVLPFGAAASFFHLHLRHSSFNIFIYCMSGGLKKLWGVSEKHHISFVIAVTQEVGHVIS